MVALEPRITTLSGSSPQTFEEVYTHYTLGTFRKKARHGNRSFGATRYAMEYASATLIVGNAQLLANVG